MKRRNHILIPHHHLCGLFVGLPLLDLNTCVCIFSTNRTRRKRTCDIQDTKRRINQSCFNIIIYVSSLTCGITTLFYSPLLTNYFCSFKRLMTLSLGAHPWVIDTWHPLFIQFHKEKKTTCTKRSVYRGISSIILNCCCTENRLGLV